MDIEDIRERLRDRGDTISPQLRKAASVLLSRTEDVALLSMRELSARSNVPPSNFVRLARTLGFSGYPALREVFAENLRQASGLYSARAEQLQRLEGENKEVSVVKEIFSHKIRNIEQTFHRNKPETIVETAASMHKAKRIFMVGQRSSFPVAFFFHYVLHLFSSKSVLTGDAGGTFADDMRDIGPKDLLFVISMSPYARNAILAAQYAARHRCPVVAVTDNELSPLCECSKHTIFADPTAAFFFDSIVSPLAVIEALLALLMMRGGKRALERLKTSEEQLKLFGAYWGSRDQPRSARDRPPDSQRG
jgi:DNA-binding MurR/RpiR family transcriptional regulator